MKKVIEINEYIKRKNLETLLCADFKELYDTKGKAFVINVLEYIVKSLKGIE